MKDKDTQTPSLAYDDMLVQPSVKVIVVMQPAP
jgi:hypothetical protein